LIVQYKYIIVPSCDNRNQTPGNDILIIIEKVIGPRQILEVGQIGKLACYKFIIGTVLSLACRARLPDPRCWIPNRIVHILVRLVPLLDRTLSLGGFQTRGVEASSDMIDLRNNTEDRVSGLPVHEPYLSSQRYLRSHRKSGT
jgi:hypothetical protein